MFVIEKSLITFYLIKKIFLKIKHFIKQKVHMPLSDSTTKDFAKPFLTGRWHDKFNPNMDMNNETMKTCDD